MNWKGSLNFLAAAFLFLTFLSAGTAAAQTNTVYGIGALANPSSNATGNSAFGYFALFSTTSGFNNTAIGGSALGSNTTGSHNTASGYAALSSNTTGYYNTASGPFALGANTTGYYNTASGFSALTRNTTGGFNSASGANALESNTTGFYNTASGADALVHSTGTNNIGIGYRAGFDLTTGHNNIDVGNRGVKEESDTIRIGTEQTRTFIAGIAGVPISGSEVVVVDASGQLGVSTSSARYKHDIRDMGGASSGVLKLRPVTFRYNQDPSNTLQYGLVAEEVAKSYPELVDYGKDGRPQSVRYLELSAMLLNEMRKQAQENARQERDIRTLQARLAALEHAQAASSAIHLTASLER